MKCRTSFLQKVVIFLDDLHEVRDCAGFVLDPPMPRENMLMEGIVPGWLGKSPAPAEKAEMDQVGFSEADETCRPPPPLSGRLCGLEFGAQDCLD